MAEAGIRRPTGAAVMAPLTLEVLTDRAAFEALKPEWDALFARAGTPQQLFLRHAFLRHWCDHYLDARSRICILAGRSEGRLVMLWPLVRRRSLGLDIVQLIGAPVAQFGDVLVEPSPDRQRWLDAGWAALGRLGADLFEIRQLRADAALSRPEAALLVQKQEAPFADLAQRVSADGPSMAYPARERSNYRRRLRRLAERGELGFSALIPGAEARTLAITAVTMKRRALARHGILAPTVADPRFLDFFAALAGDAVDEAGLRLSIISCAGRPIGIDISFDCLGRSFGHVIASDPDFDREGIGRVLIHQAFVSARARGSAVFDLLAPADPYKLDHADGSVAVYDLAVPLSWRGRLICALALPRLRPVLRAMAKRLPTAWVRRWLKAGLPSG
jgi:CelD/BcsL family acetyltransferase involved in cellulose biosynthesis